MANIGGNILGVIQTATTTKNAIHETVKEWSDAFRHTGWLGLQSGDSKYTNFNAKLEEFSIASNTLYSNVASGLNLDYVDKGIIVIYLLSL